MKREVGIKKEEVDKMTSRKLILFLFIGMFLIVGISFVNAAPEDGMKLVFNDTFTDTTGTFLTAHTPDLGTSWTGIYTSGDSHLQITSNELDATNGNNDGVVNYANIAQTWTNDQMVKITYSAQDNSDDYVHLIVRADSTMANAYVFSFSITADNTYLWKRVASVNTQINTSCGANNQFVTGDIVKLKVIGNLIEVYEGNTLVCSATDTDISSGRAGVGIGSSYIDTGGDVSDQRADDLLIYIVEAPNITALDTPADNAYFNTGASIDFNFTVQDDSGFTNATLYGNWTGAWHANQTLTSINNGTITNFTSLTLPNGTYIWNVLVYDDSPSLLSDWFDNNYTFTIDTVYPTFTFNSPANDSISQNNSWELNITVNDNRDEIIVKIYGGNETGFYQNNSLLYKRIVANNTEIIYNWTAPVLNVTSDTVLLMHFDDEGEDNATHVYDETGKNNGTKLVSGAPVWNESGKFGYALGFDGGDDSASISDSDSLDLIGNFSINFWAYPTDLSNNQTFLAKGSGTTTNYFIDYKTTTEIEFGFYNGVWRSVVVDASTFTANQWNLITATRNATSNISIVYINGIDKGSLQLNYAPLANSNALKLGSFPGYDQNYTGLMDELIIYNKTLSSTEITNIYQLKEDNWYWRVDLNDTASNMNYSEIRIFTIGTIWDVSPIDLGSVGTALNTVTRVGNLTINNTHSGRNITINITHDYSGVVTFNETLPFILNYTGSGNNTKIVQINVTSLATEGLTTINFNITAVNNDTKANSIPFSRIVPVTLVATSSNPFLITNFETYPTIVSQNSTGYSLKASVYNRGQGNAQNVIIQFQLPIGWTNSSGTLNQALGILTVNEQKNASIIVGINSTATAGTVTLYVNISGQNSTGSDIGSGLKTIDNINVTVNEISTGAGPTIITPSAGGTTAGGGGGGGGGTVLITRTAETFELIRGKETDFQLEIKNKDNNRTMKNIEVEVSGFLGQYIELLNIPSEIFPASSANFTVKIIAPRYFTTGEWNLVFDIKANLEAQGISTKAFNEKKSVRLFIQDIGKEEARDLINESLDKILELESLNLTAKKLRTLLSELKEKFEEGEYEIVQKLSDELSGMADKAINVYNEIQRFTTMVEEANSRGIKTPGTLRLVLLAKSALEREDYDLATLRLKEFELTFALETKGEFSLIYFVKNNPIKSSLISISNFALIIVLIYGIRLKRINIKLKNREEERKIIRELIKTAQRECFEKKTIDLPQYRTIILQYEKRMSAVLEEIVQLQSSKATLLKPSLKKYELEHKRLLDLIKQTQDEYIVKGTEDTEVYRSKIKSYSTRLSEIEGKLISSQAKAAIKREKRNKFWKKFGINLQKNLEQIDKKKPENEKKLQIPEEGKKTLGIVEKTLFKNFFENKMEQLNNFMVRRKEKKLVKKYESYISDAIEKTRKKRLFEETEKKKMFEKIKEKNKKKLNKIEKGFGNKKDKGHGLFEKLSSLFRKFKFKIKSKNLINNVKDKLVKKKDKEGIMLVDHSFIDKLKEKLGDEDYSGKWLGINLKNEKKI